MSGLLKWASLLYRARYLTYKWPHFHPATSYGMITPSCAGGLNVYCFLYSLQSSVSNAAKIWRYMLKGLLITFAGNQSDIQGLGVGLIFPLRWEIKLLVGGKTCRSKWKFLFPLNVQCPPLKKKERKQKQCKSIKTAPYSDDACFSHYSLSGLPFLLMEVVSQK